MVPFGGFGVIAHGRRLAIEDLKDEGESWRRAGPGRERREPVEGIRAADVQGARGTARSSSPDSRQARQRFMSRRFERDGGDAMLDAISAFDAMRHRGT